MVCGLPELFADQIPGADLVANPGCYPTVAALTIAPVLQRGLVRSDGIVIHAASGISGAGRTAKPHLNFSEMNDAYAPSTHRHQPEIEQVSSSPVSLLFTPHYLPVDRGILESICMDPVNGGVTQEDLFTAFEDVYSKEAFIRVRADLPNIKHVRDTNFCDLTVCLVKGKVVVFSAIDNLLKGASRPGGAEHELHVPPESNTGVAVVEWQDRLCGVGVCGNPKRL